MSWDEFSFKKGEFAFVAQNYEHNKLIPILDNRRQTTIRNFFLKYPLKVRQKVRFITMDMSGALYATSSKTFSKAPIIILLFYPSSNPPDRLLSPIPSSSLKKKKKNSPLK